MYDQYRAQTDSILRIYYRLEWNGMKYVIMTDKIELRHSAFNYSLRV